MSTGDKLSGIVSPPRAGEIFVASVSTTTAAVDLNVKVTPDLSGSLVVDDYWRGRYVTIQADGGDVYISFTHDNTDTLDSTVNSASSASMATTCCIKIVDGQEKNIYVGGGKNNSYRYLLHRTASGTAQLRMWASSPKG